MIFDNVKSLVVIEVCVVNAVNYFLIYPWILVFIFSNMILKYKQNGFGS